jgi:hypothetical protein
MSKSSLVGRLREQGAHYRRRLGRMEELALAARVDFEKFPACRAYVEGLADAYTEALAIIGDEKLTEKAEVDPCVVMLAREGLSVVAIANRCGVSVHDVAAALVRYIELGGAAGGEEEEES